MKTPITDKLATFRPDDDGVTDFVPASLARRLESVANLLADALRRTPYEECGESNHSGGHYYHGDGEQCPVVARARDALAAYYDLSNVPDEVSLLASGTKACSAGDVPEVPQAQGLTPSACSHF